MACPESATLHNGAKMPLLGYGTFQAKAGELEPALEAALEAGYRHIDTAFIYENEGEIGQILEKWIKAGKLKREDLFITTKLPPTGVKPGGPAEYLGKSLAALRLDYVDLYLIHAPFKWFEPETTIDHVAGWKELEALVDAGKTKAIGLSNFNKRQIQNVIDHSRIKPANLQIELHVYMQQKPLVEYCNKNGISVTAYAPLGSPGSQVVLSHLPNAKPLPDLINHPVVVEIAKKHGKAPGQVLLKHIVQKGIIAIPKSITKARVAQNIDLFDFTLDKAEIAKLDALDLGKDGRIFAFMPADAKKDDPCMPFFEYP